MFIIAYPFSDVKRFRLVLVRYGMVRYGIGGFSADGHAECLRTRHQAGVRQKTSSPLVASGFRLVQPFLYEGKYMKKD